MKPHRIALTSDTPLNVIEQARTFASRVTFGNRLSFFVGREFPIAGTRCATLIIDDEESYLAFKLAIPERYVDQVNGVSCGKDGKRFNLF